MNTQHQKKRTEPASRSRSAPPKIDSEKHKHVMPLASQKAPSLPLGARKAKIPLPPPTDKNYLHVNYFDNGSDNEIDDEQTRSINSDQKTIALHKKLKYGAGLPTSMFNFMLNEGFILPKDPEVRNDMRHIIKAIAVDEIKNGKFGSSNIGDQYKKEILAAIRDMELQSRFKSLTDIQRFLLPVFFARMSGYNAGHCDENVANALVAIGNYKNDNPHVFQNKTFFCFTDSIEDHVFIVVTDKDHQFFCDPGDPYEKIKLPKDPDRLIILDTWPISGGTIVTTLKNKGPIYPMLCSDTDLYSSESKYTMKNVTKEELEEAIQVVDPIEYASAYRELCHVMAKLGFDQKKVNLEIDKALQKVLCNIEKRQTTSSILPIYNKKGQLNIKNEKATNYANYHAQRLIHEARSHDKNQRADNIEKF